MAVQPTGTPKVEDAKAETPPEQAEAKDEVKSEAEGSMPVPDSSSHEDDFLYNEARWDNPDYAPHKRHSITEDPTGEKNAKLLAKSQSKSKSK